ncbi:MAG TPA: AraC family transcriptional regulator [Steroidobacteraceae bacterium]
MNSLEWQALSSADPYRTTDLDAARHYIGALFVPHRLEVLGRGQVLDVCVSRAQMAGISLVYHRHGARVRVRAEPLRSFFLLQIPIAGEAIVKMGSQEVLCDSMHGVMIAPTIGVDMKFDCGCEQLILRVDKWQLEQQLELHLGHPLTGPLEFASRVSLGSPGFEQIKALLKLLSVIQADRQGICTSQLARVQMSRLVHSALLTCLEHNYACELKEAASLPAPSYIRRARDFVAGNATKPLNPKAIADAAHISTRALYAGFKATLGTTPMRYLKDLRLDLARQSLSSHDADWASITSLALQLGFQHLGHFSIAYKKRFGELPRDTLRKKCGSVKP